MSSGSRKDLEEERRLFYVGMTRAERKLTLSYANSRFRFGQLLPCEPSRFISEIVNDFIELDKKTFKQKVDADESRSRGGGFAAKPKPSFQNKYGRTNKTAPSKPLPPPIENFVPDDTKDIKVGDNVEHQRFGKGSVEKIDGDFGNKKATILFDQFGKKQLVLKFAKLRFVKA